MHPARIMDLGRLHPRAVRRDSPARQGARGAGRSLGGDAGRLVAGELTERHRQGAAASCLKAVLPPAAQGAVLKKFTCAALTFDVQGWSYNILNMRWLGYYVPSLLGVTCPTNLSRPLSCEHAP